MRKKGFLFVSFAAVLLFSCTTPKNVVYFQDAGNFEAYKKVEQFDVFIHQDDMLAIMVNSQATEAALPFNLPIVSYYVGGDVYGQQRVLGYLVDKEGCIDFPILGKLQVEGLTRNGLRDLIKSKLKENGLLKDPIVTVNFLNYKVSVQGEVNRPGSFNVTGERITLLEALSMAGDLTIYGRRDRVAVIREVKGQRTILYHDLSSTDIFQSPCYYLQQNDMVYVEPNKRRIQQSNINQNNSAGVWLSIISVLLTATNVIVSVNKK
ncbi:MAG: polysaccharide biosynthesis/export family protein [Tannerella sp.]|jgi:polysaccharide export outer membrane protein|nr:polysaccharide biosynthesis/export family protein [Tannerella sp.]